MILCNFVTLILLLVVSPSFSSSLKQSTLGVSNINELVDLSLKKLRAHYEQLDFITLNLPNITTDVEVKLTNFSGIANINLSGGHLFNVSSLQRFGDSFMTLSNNAFVLAIGFLIPSQKYKYNVKVSSGSPTYTLRETIKGEIINTTIKANLSISISDLRTELIDLEIVSFGIISAILKNPTLKDARGFVIKPVIETITNTHKNTITDYLKPQLQHTVNEIITKNDLLDLKETKKRLINMFVG